MSRFSIDRRAALKLSLAGFAAALGAGPGRALDTPRDQGIGGTGAFGEIIRFGSIVVNDVEFDFDADTPIRDDLGGSGPDRLAVGKVVRVTSPGVGDHIAADSIAIEHEAFGPVEAIDVDAGELTVLGQKASYAFADDDPQPAVGDWIALSGFRDGDGVILATHIEPAPEGTFQIIGQAGQVGDFAQAAVAKAKIAGRAIVRGHQQGETYVVDSVAPWTFFAPQRKFQRLAIEGVYAKTVGSLFDLRKLKQAGSNLVILDAILDPAGEYRVLKVVVVPRPDPAAIRENAEKRRRSESQHKGRK